MPVDYSMYIPWLVSVHTRIYWDGSWAACQTQSPSGLYQSLPPAGPESGDDWTKGLLAPDRRSSACAHDCQLCRVHEWPVFSQTACRPCSKSARLGPSTLASLAEGSSGIPREMARSKRHDALPVEHSLCHLLFLSHKRTVAPSYTLYCTSYIVHITAVGTVCKVKDSVSLRVQVTAQRTRWARLWETSFPPQSHHPRALVRIQKTASGVLYIVEVDPALRPEAEGRCRANATSRAGPLMAAFCSQVPQREREGQKAKTPCLCSARRRHTAAAAGQ